MYSYLKYKKSGIHDYDAFIDEQLEIFKRDCLDKLFLCQRDYFDISFFAKNLTRAKFTPIEVERIHYKTEFVNIHDNATDNFKKYQEDRYTLSQNWFKEKLELIEYYYKENLTYVREKAHLHFPRAIASAFHCKFKTANFLLSLFQQHFSFERGVFREYNYELFNDSQNKEILFTFSKFKSEYKVTISENHFAMNNDYLKTVGKNKIFQEQLWLMLKKYILALNDNSLLAHKKFLLLKTIRNFTTLKIVRRKMIDFCYLRFINNSEKSLMIPSIYKTNLSYKLFYFLDLGYSLKKHPLKYINNDFDVNLYEVSELEEILDFISKNILQKRNSKLDICNMVYVLLRIKKDLLLKFIRNYNYLSKSVLKIPGYYYIYDRFFKNLSLVKNNLTDDFFKFILLNLETLFQVNIEKFIELKAKDYKDYMKLYSLEMEEWIPTKYRKNDNFVNLMKQLFFLYEEPEVRYDTKANSNSSMSKSFEEFTVKSLITHSIWGWNRAISREEASVELRHFLFNLFYEGLKFEKAYRNTPLYHLIWRMEGLINEYGITTLNNELNEIGYIEFEKKYQKPNIIDEDEIEF